MLIKVPTDAELDRAEIAAAPPGESLYRFVKRSWDTVETVPYKDNWHIPIACEYLADVSLGRTLRLVINQPPSTMKSLLTSVLWPVWHWIRIDLACKWMYASYDASLVGMIQGGKIIDLLQSQWFIERWGNILKDTAPSAAMFYTTGGGFRFATSPGGKGTGRHVHIQVMDDLVKPQDTQGSVSVTAKTLKKVSQWVKGTASSRSIDPATFARVIQMQRVNASDPAGEALAEGGWRHLCFPMRYETAPCECGDLNCTPEDPRTEEGELLWEERFPEEVVKHQETIGMGPAVAAAQYQQRPSPVSGGIFKAHDFRYWHYEAGQLNPQEQKFRCRDKYAVVLPDLSSGTLYQSWDFAFKDTEGSDFVAGGVWLFKYPDAYMVDCLWRRMDFPESLEAMIEMCDKYPGAITKYVEDKANGSAIISTVKSTIAGVEEVDPAGGKIARAHAVSGLYKTGHVFWPHPSLAPWVTKCRSQHVSFPRGAHDDMVDQGSQILLKLKPLYALGPAMDRLLGVKK